MAVTIWQQGQETGSLDRCRQLPLIPGLGTGYPAGDDLTRFSNVSLQGIEILVIDFFNTLCCKFAKSSASEKF